MRLKDEEANELLDPVPDELRAECWWLVHRDRTPVAGNRGGGVELLLSLRATRPIGRILNALGLSPVMDLGDRILDKLRSPLSRVVPDGPAPRRYP